MELNLACFDCGQPTSPDIDQCPACGSLEVGSQTSRPTRFPQVEGGELPWPWSSMAWRSPAMLLLSGSPGAGKSSLAAQLNPRLYITTEQTHAEAVSTIRRVQGESFDPPMVASVGSAEELEELLNDQALGRGRVVVLDSVTEIGDLEEGVRAAHVLRAWAYNTGCRGVLIAQHTKDGKAAGRLKLPHLVDIVASCQGDVGGLRRLTVSKNRHGPLFTSYFRNDAEGIGTPRFKAGYSVEGDPGSYRLVPHPTKGAKWAAPFSKAKGIEGKACAARKCEAYSSGWLEPEDVEERRRFAEAHGLEWLTPSSI